MKVNCNFLPLDYRAYILEAKVLAISVLLYVLSAGIWATVFVGHSKEVKNLGNKIRQKQQEKVTIQEERAQTVYPQERITKLIDQFSFIQKAMGAKDFPWLRFYQSLEDAIPTADSGRRGVFFVRLIRSGERSWQLEGEAEDWRDATKFEEELIKSSYATQGQAAKRNFSDVRLISYIAVEGGKGYRFKLEFSFVDNF